MPLLIYKEGFSILRSYLEINLSIFIENTMNQILRNMKPSEYQDKKIIFEAHGIQ
jgi:hypothetical protein